MPDSIPQFSQEQLAHQSKINAAATILSILAFLKQRQITGLDWINFMGTTFATSWMPFKAEGPRKAAELIALDMVSIGAKVVTFSTDSENSIAEAVFENWPDPALLSAFDLTTQEAFEFMQIFASLAKPIGLGFTAELETKENESTVLEPALQPSSKRWQIRVRVWQE